MTLYKLEGEVFADDGSSYEVTFYGTLIRCNLLLETVAEQANEVGDTFTLSIRPDRPDFDPTIDPPTVWMSNRGPVAA